MIEFRLSRRHRDGTVEQRDLPLWALSIFVLVIALVTIVPWLVGAMTLLTWLTGGHHG